MWSKILKMIFKLKYHFIIIIMKIEKECLKIISEKFWKLIKDNLDKDWNWNYITSNPNIDMEIIKANPNKLWNFGFLKIQIMI